MARILWVVESGIIVTLGITVSTDRSFDGPSSSESRRIKASARARRALNAAVCRKLQNHLNGGDDDSGGGGGDGGGAEDDAAKVKRQMYKEQRQIDEGDDEGPDIGCPKDEVEDNVNGGGAVVDLNGGGGGGGESESEGEYDEEEDSEDEELLEDLTLVEFFERLAQRDAEEEAEEGKEVILLGSFGAATRTEMDVGVDYGDQLSVVTLRRRERLQRGSGVRNSYVDGSEGSSGRTDVAVSMAGVNDNDNERVVEGEGETEMATGMMNRDVICD